MTASKRLLSGAAALLASLLALVAAPGRGQGPLETVRLADNLHLIHVPERLRTNMLVLTGPDGTLLVDYENPSLTSLGADEETLSRVTAALERLDALPVRYLINTHWHPDHVGGNAAVGADAVIVTHAETRRLLATRQEPEWLEAGVGPMPAAGLPDLVFEDSVTLHLNGEEVELLNFGPAHTEGDAVVWLKRAGVIHMGDLFQGFDSLALGRDMQGVARTYGAVLERVPADVRVVTGHGAVVERAELERTHAMLSDVLAWMKTELGAGAAVEELASKPLPAPWEEAWPADPEVRRRRFGALFRYMGESPATDEERLLELHREVLAAHLESDVDRLLAAESPESVVAGRGEISRPTLEERREGFTPYLSATAFRRYEDLVEPIVKVSEDGTLGWVIAQVGAAGVQTRPDGTVGELEFVSAWIELYEKRDGEWLRTGNVSNFAPR